MYLVDVEGTGCTQPADREPRGMLAFIEWKFGPQGPRRASGPKGDDDGPEIGLSDNWIELEVRSRSNGVCECCGRHPVQIILYPEGGLRLDDGVLNDPHLDDGVLDDLLGVCYTCRRMLCPDSTGRGYGMSVIEPSDYHKEELCTADRSSPSFSTI